MGATQSSKRVIHTAPGSLAREEIEEQVAEQEKEDVPPSGDELREMIAVAAYYRAQSHNFAPGHELEDWLAAEAEICDRFGLVAGQ